MSVLYLSGLDYSQRLTFLGLETLEVRRIKYDLIMCYKILNSEVSLKCIFFDLSALTYTRGHQYYKKQSSINAYKYFFSNRICDIWNALPKFVFDLSSSNNFRRLLDKVDLSQFTVLLWLFIVVILSGICKWLHALYVQWIMFMFIFIKRCWFAWLIIYG